MVCCTGTNVNKSDKMFYVFDPNKWLMVVTRLCFLGSVRITMLYINITLSVGGHDGPLVRKSVESYNPDNNRSAYSLLGESRNPV